MSDTRSRILDMLEREGRFMPLRRRVGTTNSFVDVPVLAVVSGYQPQELIGGIIQGDRKVVFANQEIEEASWPGPPRRGDVMVIDGAAATIQQVVPMYRHTTIVAFIAQVRG